MSITYEARLQSAWPSPPPPTACRRLPLCAADSNIGDADAAALGMDTQPPEFYDEEADERNEAWVQKMRRWAPGLAVCATHPPLAAKTCPPPPPPLLHAIPVPAPDSERV